VLVHGLKFQRRKQLINMWIKKKKNQTGLIFFFFLQYWSLNSGPTL
jgi:hypothetical protein